MNSRSKGLAIVLGATAFALQVSSASAQETPWGFEITPYLWGMGIDADLKVRGHDASVDTSFSDLVDRIDVGGSLFMHGSVNHFVIMTQLDYVSTDTDELDSDERPAGGKVGKLETQTFMGTLAAGYRFGEPNGKRALELLLGARQLSFDTDLTLNSVGKFSRDSDYYDPIIMLRPSFRISDRWRFGSTIAYGTGGDAESTWELAPTFFWQINDHLAMRLGYRRVYYDLKSDNDMNQFDGSFQGFVIGLGGTFGPNHERVAQVTPPPEPEPMPQPVARAEPAPVVMAPGDSDGDGVNDQIDKCPNTAAGEKVDSIGCGINVTLHVQFAHDSAEIPSDAQPELQRLVQIMNSTSVISGVVEGYTDATGSASYNAQLSKKRAEAVADYLIAHGVSRDRLTTKGFGEANPVADNRTEEGRAENRRVVLRRIDIER